jgi:lipoprotein-anchoring transpeptidase ErfK/SrfK
MARVRAGSGRLLFVMAGFIVSAVLAAELTTHAAPSRAVSDRPLTAPVPASSFKLAAPPVVFTSRGPLRLADPTGLTRWAPVLHAFAARVAPSIRSRRVGWVPTRTGDHTANIVVADREAVRGSALWERVRLTALPNGAEGWVPRGALGGWSFVHTRLVVDRRRLTATLTRAGRVVFRAPVAIGTPGTPTPAGRFYVRDRLSGFRSPMYGPLAFGTNARSPTLTDWPDGGIVGIHGTNRPDLIPGRVSHGCIRMTNPAIVRLGRLMSVGTAVIIR